MESNLTVWKFPLTLSGEITIGMPEGAEVLFFGMQFGAPVMWARVNPDNQVVQRVFAIRGTGHPGAAGQYLGTIQLSNGLVFHLFEQAAGEN